MCAGSQTASRHNIPENRLSGFQPGGLDALIRARDQNCKKEEIQ
jgi:hypothetical protein